MSAIGDPGTESPRRILVLLMTTLALVSAISALAAATRFAIEVGALTTTRAGAEPPTLAELAGVAAV